MRIISRICVLPPGDNPIAVNKYINISSPCIPVRVFIPRTTSTLYIYVSTTPQIVHSSTRHSLDFNSYTSTVMQYTTRYLPTGTAVTSNLHTPHQHGSPPCLDTSTESYSLHRHTHPGQRTRLPPRLRNIHLRKPLTRLHGRQPFNTNRTSWNWTPQRDKILHHGNLAFSTLPTIADIDMAIIEIYYTRPLEFPHVFEHNRSNTCPTPLHLWTILFLLGSWIYNSYSYNFNNLLY